MKFNKINIGYIFFIFLLIFSLNCLRLYYETHFYFDQAIYNNLFFNTLNDKYWMLFFGHFQPLIIFFSLLTKLFDSFFIVNLILILIKGIIIIIPFALYYNKNFILVYSLSLSSIIWYNSLGTFHIDLLILPLSFIYFYFIENEKYRKAIYTLIICCLVKEIYIIIAAIYSIMLIKKIPTYKFLILNIFFLIFFLITYLYLIPQFTYFNKNDIFETGNYRVDIYDWILHLDNFDPILNFKLIFKKVLMIFSIGFFYYISFFKASKRYLTITLLILSIFFFSKNINHSSIQTHYLIPLVAPMFYSFKEYYSKFLINNNYLRYFVLIYITFAHVVISPSPISVSFYTNINSYFKYSNYYNKKNEEQKKIVNNFFADIKSDKIIASANNSYFTIFNKFQHYLPFPAGLNEKFYLPENIDINKFFKIFLNKEKINKIILIPDYIILEKNNYWIYDEKYSSKHDILKYNKSLKENYYIAKQEGELLIYEKK